MPALFEVFAEDARTCFSLSQIRWEKRETLSIASRGNGTMRLPGCSRLLRTESFEKRASTFKGPWKSLTGMTCPHR